MEKPKLIKTMSSKYYDKKILEAVFLLVTLGWSDNDWECLEYVIKKCLEKMHGSWDEEFYQCIIEEAQEGHNLTLRRVLYSGAYDFGDTK